MPHTITYHPETHITETTAHGTINLNELKQIFAEAIQLAVGHGHFLFLTDFRAATLNLSMLDIYNAPHALAEVAQRLNLDARTFKRALVVNASFLDMHFAETVTVSQGQWAKFFYDIDKARHWLTNKHTLT